MGGGAFATKKAVGPTEDFEYVGVSKQPFTTLDGMKEVPVAHFTVTGEFGGEIGFSPKNMKKIDANTFQFESGGEKYTAVRRSRTSEDMKFGKPSYVDIYKVKEQ